MSLLETSTKTMHLAALRCAALLVPIRQRAEWLQEWTSELWYVHQACITERGPSWQAERDVAAFCLGAFNDAICLRRHAPRTKSPKAHPLHSAAQCALFLTILAATAWCLALLLPGVRAAVQPTPYRDIHNLIAISANGRSETPIPTIRADQYRSWRNRTQHLFTDFAFYQTSIKLLHIAPHHTPQISVARASANLFDLLGVSLTFASQPAHDGVPTLVLSEKLWRTTFSADPEIIGRTLKLGLRPVRIVGILPEGSWQLPGKVDAWLLEPDEHAAAIPATTRGYVIARRDPSSQTPSTGTWRLFIPQSDDKPAFDCLSLADRMPDTFGIFTFTLLLALLALPATTSLPLGEYPANRHNLRWSIKLRRWIFLSSKLALILPIVYFGSLDLAHFSTSITPEAAQYLQGISSFSALLFAFRWTLRDQRKRCPVCLRLLTNPARVGQPSRNFLAWNGTELICAGGHGLLHVPEIATSWFSTQRWLYLDPSWKGLFSETAPASAGLF